MVWPNLRGEGPCGEAVPLRQGAGPRAGTGDALVDAGRKTRKKGKAIPASWMVFPGWPCGWACLLAVLAGMGMPDAFGASADFSGMTGSKGLSISAVFHNAFVSVDEEGTEATAATVMVLQESIYDIEPIPVTVNRPFIFLIRDTDTGAVLFLGRVMNPDT